jgi:hypothetical protein
MRPFIGTCLLAAAILLSESATELWTGYNSVQAQSSACVQNCQNVRHWPEAQCRAYCAKQHRSGR